MANFDILDDDYGDLFITQKSNVDNTVSLGGRWWSVKSV